VSLAMATGMALSRDRSAPASPWADEAFSLEGSLWD
jgi:hypothetical protein